MIRTYSIQIIITHYNQKEHISIRTIKAWIENSIQKEIEGPKNSDNLFGFNITKDDKIADNTKDNNSELPSKYTQVDDEIMEDMQTQVNYNVDSITQTQLESIEKLKELFNH